VRIIPQGEASFDVVFFTADFGKITARAQSARELRSTMRMFLVRYGFVTINLVRGKNVWRLTGIAGFSEHAPDPSYLTQTPFPKITRLIEQLVTNESDQQELFSYLYTYACFVRSLTDTTCLEGSEIIAVIHILTMLGYWNHSEEFLLNETSCKTIVEQKKELIKKINESLDVSQMNF
jgi:recombinational DNA repair protein (RecF pathway)